MAETLRGIVLRTVKFGDNGHIVDMFTDRHGRMSFVMKRATSARSERKIVPSLFMPLSLLEFECTIHRQDRLPQPRNPHPYRLYQSLQLHPVKSTQVLFLAEFMVNALREADADTRNTEAVKRIATAYLKLLFPNVRTAKDVDVHQFQQFCLRPAVKMRQIIFRQLGILDSQYRGKNMPQFSVKEISDENKI